jgi:arabinogalactan oligomer/maltooligosaccharide transport system permease protein
MEKICTYLYDNWGREYKRKNQYLYEVAILQDQISDANGNEKVNLKNDLNKLVKDKSNHTYYKELTEFRNKEKKYIMSLKEEYKKNKIDYSLPRNVRYLQKRLFRAEKNVLFYEEYIDLTYDAQLIYEQSKIEIEQIPPIIKFAQEALNDYKNAKDRKKNINEEQIKKFKVSYANFKKEEKEKLVNDITKIKVKHKEGLISSKAKDVTIKALKRDYKEKKIIKSLECENNYYSELIKSKKHQLHKVVNQKIKALNINVAAIRRACPIEKDRMIPWKSYATCLIPGLGQLLNKQYIKAIIMFIATLFIYFIAIPYALGFGNYQGQGIAGLITLAENGSRIDRSIIFMIEGLIAIALLAISLILLILSFKDVRKVEKDEIKGIRVRSWCETKQTLFEDGLPYMISMPALIVIVFIVFIPIATAILLSFTGMDPKHQAKFGWEALSNYKMIVLGKGLAGKVFWRILGWTIIWTIAGSTLGIALGFILAIILNNDRIKGKILFRSIYLLPWAVPSFITILFFSILAAPNGVMSSILSNVIGTKIPIKNNAFWTRTTLICVQGWLGSAYVFLLSTGVLQSISKDLYEAADIDGASNYKKLTKITVPLVLFQTGPLLVGQYTFNFNNFSIIYLFNNGGPFNPIKYGNLAGSTDLLISYIYKLTFENQYQAMGAAITVIISILLMIVAYIGFRNTEAFRKEK